MRTSIVLATSVGELTGLRSEWETLSAHAIEPNPLYEPWMLIPALEADPQRSSFLCVFIRVEGVLAGVFPLRRISRYKKLPITVLRSWWHGSWMLGTPLLHRHYARHCLAAFFAWLRSADASASAVEFVYVPSDGAFHSLLADTLLMSHPAMVFVTERFTRALLRRSTDAESYLAASLSASDRKNVRRRERRLREVGELAAVAMTASGDPMPWIRVLLRLEASGWKGRSGSALACNERNARFAEVALSEAHARGRLQLVGLDFGGHPIARCCNVLAGPGSFAYRTAYDEAFARYAPGVALEIESIRQFHALPDVQWMDSLTDPANHTLNRLWKDRRTMQSLLVGASPWGDLWTSMLPLLRLMARGVRSVLGEKTPQARAGAEKQVRRHEHHSARQ